MITLVLLALVAQAPLVAAWPGQQPQLAGDRQRVLLAFVRDGAIVVLRSADRGQSWQISETPLAAGQSAGIYSIAFRDARHGIVVGGDYAKEADAIDNVAVTSDGGVTWTLVRERGLAGFRSVVAHQPGTDATFFAVGPLGTDVTKDDGRSWSRLEGPGFDTFSFARRGPGGWAAGSQGRIAVFR